MTVPMGPIELDPSVNTPATPTPAPTDTNSQITGGVATAKSGSKTNFKNMEELRKENPKLYNKMLEGIAQTICYQMKDRQDRINEIMKEGRRGG